MTKMPKTIYASNQDTLPNYWTDIAGGIATKYTRADDHQSEVEKCRALYAFNAWLTQIQKTNVGESDEVTFKLFLAAKVIREALS